MAVCCRFVEIVRRTNFGEFAVAIDRPIQVPRIRPRRPSPSPVVPFGYGRVQIVAPSAGVSFDVGTRIYSPSPVSLLDYGRGLQSWRPPLNILHCCINYFNDQIMRLIRRVPLLIFSGILTGYIILL